MPASRAGWLIAAAALAAWVATCGHEWSGPGDVSDVDSGADDGSVPPDGADGDAVHRGVQATLERHGFQTGEVNGRMQGFFHGTGHGLGLEVHELPRVSKVPATLRTGNVVTVEPGLYYPGIGGVRIEDVVVVTERGCTNLTAFPKTLEV